MPQLWSEGDLRGTTLGTNGFPPEHEPALPDEMYLGTDDGEVQIIRESVDAYTDAWAVSGPADGYESTLLFDDFEDAFKRALVLVRQEAEG